MVVFLRREPGRFWTDRLIISGLSHGARASLCPIIGSLQSAAPDSHSERQVQRAEGPMATTYLKKPTRRSRRSTPPPPRRCARMLGEIQAGGEEAVRRYARDLDGYSGEIVLGEAALRRRRSGADARHQGRHPLRARPRAGLRPPPARLDARVQAELMPGLDVGQRLIPCNTAGCYVPGRPLCACRQRDHERGHGAGGGREAHRRHLAGDQGPRRAPRHPLRDEAVRRAHRARARRRAGRGGPGLRHSSAATRPTSSSGPATASSPKPSACCSAASASTWWPGRPSRP